MAASITEILALVRIATIKSPGTPLVWLKALLVAIYDGGDFSSGKILVSSTEVGGTVTFAVPPGHTPQSLLCLVESAIEWLQQQPDPTSPNLSPRRIRRLRVSFAKAVA